MKVRITQTDIARVAGVHNTTVSLSLRNSRLIPPATRKRIQAIAESMGYCPDPALRALVAYRNGCRERRQMETLAYVTNWETKWGWRGIPAHEIFYTAARRRAAELGYQIEHLWLGETGMSQRRLDSMLLHRGISGVLLASHRMSCDELEGINWSRLSAVKIGCFPHSPAVNQVMVDPGSVVRLAMGRVQDAGYQRIGLVVSQRWDELADQAWSAAFHTEQRRSRSKDPMPVLYLHDPRTKPSLTGKSPRYAGDTGALARWYRAYRPEAIIGLAPDMSGLLEECRLRVPQDVAYADLFLQETNRAIAGVRENCEKVGELAVEMLASQLQQNLFGLPAVATVTSVGGSWHNGESLPAKILSAPEEMEPLIPTALKANLVA